MKFNKLMLCAAVFCAAGGSLATAKDKSIDYKSVDAPVAKGNYAGAAGVIVKAGNSKKSKLYPLDDKVNYNLDLGTLLHYSQQYDLSFISLNTAEKESESLRDLDTKKKDADTKLVNSAKQPYSGEAFEILYADIFEALNNYNLGTEDSIERSRIEARQATEKLAQLAIVADREAAAMLAAAKKDKNLKDLEFDNTPPVRFTNSAFANYVAMLLLRDYTDAGSFAKAVDAAYAASPSVYYNPKPKSLANEAAPPGGGKARINIIGLTGLSPIKVQEKEEKPATAITVLGILASGLGANPLLLADLTITVAYPVIDVEPESVKKNDKGKIISAKPRPRSDVITKIVVEIPGQPSFELELLEDIGKVIYDSYALKRDIMYKKAYARAVMKCIGVSTGFLTASVAAGDNTALQLGVMVGQKVAQKAMKEGEMADIRMARYLPNKAYVGGINVNPGTYDVTIKYYSKDGVIASEVKKIEAKAKQPNIIEAVKLQ